MRKLLIVEDNAGIRQSVIDYFRFKKDFVEGADSVEDALELLKKNDFDVVVTDLNLRDKSGMELIKILKGSGKNGEIIVITGVSSIDVAIEAIKSGAYQYLMKPFKLEELEIFVEKAYEKLGLQKEVKNLKEKLLDRYNFENIIFASSEMETIISKIKQIAPTDANVLLTGESGTGKEVIARTIHYNSQRRDGPLIPINCSALPETLLESELFGHEKGAFTGAVSSKKGKFELAAGGTLFLDEIGELSLFTQVKLLRFLESKEITPVGSTEVKKIDTRIVFATNKDLIKLIEEGKFREDFYYRIKVVQIDIPALRDRPADIYPLANFFMIDYSRKYQKPLFTFSKETVKLMNEYAWPGNIRELKNLIEHIVVFNNGGAIEPGMLPDYIAGIAKPRRGNGNGKGISADVPLSEIERQAVIANLKKYNNNHTKAAQALGISRATLINKIKSYNIEEEKI